LNNLILIGFKAAGKTTLGQKVASALSRPFIDTDDLFEELPSILYRKIGDELFRALEKKHLHTLQHLKGYVIATGGGTPLDSDNRAVLASLGTIVHLETPKEVILQRLGAGHHFLPDYDNRLGIYRTIAHHNVITEDALWEVIRLDPFSELPLGVSRTAVLSES
jgi:shikimate kinase